MARGAGLFTSSAIMGAGTATSRVLGLLRVGLLVTAIGQNTSAADAFGLANTLPNTIYMLIAGGALNAILVPQIVKASKAGDGGADYLNRLVTWSLLALVVIAAFATLAAPWLIGLYVSANTDSEVVKLAIAFGYICLPQVMFYGLYTVLGQILNARGSFGPYMWAPVANNIVAIVGLALFIGLFGSGNSPTTVHEPASWDALKLGVLAGTATLGVAVQAFILVPALRKIGFSYRPRLGSLGESMSSAGRVAGWTFAGLVIGQAILVLVTRAATSVRTGETDLSIPGVMAYQNSYLLFMLPHGIIVVSLVTALFTRMSENATQANHDAVARDTSFVLRVVGLIMILATTGLVTLGEPIAMILVNQAEQAISLARVVAVMSLGLVFFSATYVLQRVFYAYEDGRGPFFAQLPGFAVMAAANIAALYVPVNYTVICIAAGIAAGHLCSFIAAMILVRKHARHTGARTVAGVWVRAIIAGATAGVVGRMLIDYPLHTLVDTRLEAIVAVAVAGVAVVGVYVALLMVLRVREVTQLRSVGARRFSRT